jgi:pimeloyl-ACP methyl ester carboxylesterase
LKLLSLGLSLALSVPLSSVAIAAPPTAPSPLVSPGGCAPRSWVAGQTRFCDGAAVYGDYVYDAVGAPEGESNAGDLVRLTVDAEGRQLRVSFLMEALYPTSTTTGFLAIDTDADRRTGGGAWRRLPVRSSGWERLYAIDRRDPDTNLIQGVVPRPHSERWRLQAVTANGTVVANVAFRGALETGEFYNERQSSALESGDISAFGHTVTSADLDRKVRRAPPTPRGQRIERVYTSRYTVGPGEGRANAGVVPLTDDGEEGPYYEGVPGTDQPTPGTSTYSSYGRYQPYGFYLPEEMRWHGVQTFLHGIGGRFGQLSPGYIEKFGAGQNRILVAPEGRGGQSWWNGPAERDVLDVVADVERHYAVDRDERIIAGYSMGGHGALHLATAYPDLWAGYIDWVGPTTSYCVVKTDACPTNRPFPFADDFMTNLRNLDGVMLYSGADELVPAHHAAAIRDAAMDANVPLRWFFHPAAEHLTYAVLDAWDKEAQISGRFRRVRNPARVTYRTKEENFNRRYGVYPNRAYWVSRIVPASDEEFADTDLTTHACGGRLPVLTASNGAGTDPVPWVSQLNVRTSFTKLKARRLLTGHLRNVASLRIDVTRTCLDGGRISYRLTTDRPMTVLFSDGRSVKLPAAGNFAGSLPR